MRLDKFLSSQLCISRSDAKKLLRQNRITVYGVTNCKPETNVDPDRDEIRFDGESIVFKRYIYIMMNKPTGVVSASAGEREKNVIDILPDCLKRPGLFPAGRLDKDSTGMVLITDNGQFAHYILSPAHHVEKTYLIELEKEITDEQKELIENGLDIGSEKYKPARVSLIDGTKDLYLYQIILTEGKYHEIKKMFSFLGNPVRSLHRTAIGNLQLDGNLNPGECREISTDELHLIDALFFRAH